MVILDFAKIDNDFCNGVNVVVPQYIKAQEKNAEVALINYNNFKVEGIKKQFEYKKGFNIKRLPEPFNKPDLVVFQELYNIESIQIYKDLLKNKIPYIIVPHSEMNKVAQKKKHLKKTTANILLFNKFINNAKAIHCLSEEEANSIEFDVKKFVCTNGVPKQEKVKNSFNQDKIKFIYIGRLDVYIKGIDIMLEAFAKNKEILLENNCTLDIYGPDILGRREQIEKIITDKDLGELVFIHKQVGGEEKINKYFESDIFIQTSRNEGMPVGILEALSLGMPCIITDGTNLGNIVEQYNAGWKSETNIDKLAEMIKKAILEKESLKEKSQKAIKLIDENFSWNEISERLSNVYNELLK